MSLIQYSTKTLPSSPTLLGFETACVKVLLTFIAFGFEPQLLIRTVTSTRPNLDSYIDIDILPAQRLYYYVLTKPGKPIKFLIFASSPPN